MMGRAAAIYGLAFALPAAFGFLTFSVLTHVLSPSEYGLYSTAVNAAYFLASACFSWVRFSVARYEAARDGAIAIRFWLRCLALAVPAAGLAMLALALAGLVSVPLAAVVLALGICQSLYDISGEMRRARLQARSFLAYSLSRSLLTLLLAIVVGRSFESGLLLVASLALSFLAVALANLARIARASAREEPRAMALREIAAYGLAMAVSGLVFASLGVISRLMTAQFAGLSASGPFNAALDLTGQVSGIVAMGVSSVVAPRVFKANADGDAQAVRRQLRLGGEWLLALCVPAAIGLALVAPLFARVATGPAFSAEVAVLMPWVALGLLFWNIDHYYLHIVFQMTSRPAHQVAIGGVHVVALLLASLLLIPQQGTLGAAKALFLANLLVFVLTAALARRLYRVPFPGLALAKTAFATAVMAGAVRAAATLPPAAPSAPALSGLVVEVAAGIAAYALAGFAVDLCGSRSALMARWRRAGHATG